MILATYQPKYPRQFTGKLKPAFQDLVDQLGFHPIWCFPAESLFELWMNSLLTIPSCPQKLIVFQVNECAAISKTEWESMNTEGHAPKAYMGSSIAYQERLYFEFIIDRIQNVLFEEDIIGFMDTLFDTPLVTDQMKQMFQTDLERAVKTAPYSDDPAKLQKAQENAASLVYRNYYLDSGEAMHQYCVHVMGDKRQREDIPKLPFPMPFWGQSQSYLLDLGKYFRYAMNPSDQVLYELASGLLDDWNKGMAQKQ